MDSIKFGLTPTETGRERHEATAPTGRTLERYHYRFNANTDLLLQQQNARPFLLENIPALMQAKGFH